MSRRDEKNRQAFRFERTIAAIAAIAILVLIAWISAARPGGRAHDRIFVSRRWRIFRAVRLGRGATGEARRGGDSPGQQRRIVLLRVHLHGRDEAAEQRGLLKDKDAYEVKRCQREWYGAMKYPAERQAALAVENLKIGVR